MQFNEQIKNIESAIISHIINSPEARKLIFFRLKDIDFTDKIKANLFLIIKEYLLLNQNIDEFIIKTHIEALKPNNWEQMIEIIDESLSEFPSAINFEEHIEIICNNSIINQLKNLANHYLNTNFNITKSKSINQKFMEDVYQVISSRSSNEISDISKFIDDFTQKQKFLEKNRGRIIGLTTGYKTLDELTNGFKPGELIILAARPSIGKTALALNFLLNSQICYEDPKHSVFFSLEMSAGQLIDRLVSIYSKVPTSKISGGDLNGYEKTNMNHCVEKIRDMKISIDDDSSIDINDIQAKLSNFAKFNNLGLVIIDYLQLINCEKVSGQSRTQEVARISRTLKIMAKNLNVPVIALSQLSRNIEQRSNDDKKPKLSDLRESGSIEQDADIVMFLDYNRTQIDDNKSNDNVVLYKSDIVVDLILAKNRNGVTGEMKLNFTKNTGKYDESYEGE